VGGFIIGKVSKQQKSNNIKKVEQGKSCFLKS
jgi:hypothetical protein